MPALHLPQKTKKLLRRPSQLLPLPIPRPRSKPTAKQRPHPPQNPQATLPPQPTLHSRLPTMRTMAIMMMGSMQKTRLRTSRRLSSRFRPKRWTPTVLKTTRQIPTQRQPPVILSAYCYGSLAVSFDDNKPLPLLFPTTAHSNALFLVPAVFVVFLFPLDILFAGCRHQLCRPARSAAVPRM